MKPTSIIFLVVAVLLAIGGFACMKIGENRAAQEGVELLDEINLGESDHVFTYNYDSDSIGKISIVVKEAKINIIGGADKARIELVNFPDGMYGFSSANRLLSVSNNSDLSDINNLATAAMNFKGLRSLINLYRISDREKAVNIYLTDEFPVNIVECKLEKGDVQISNNTTKTDYNIKIGEGNIDISDITTTSAANLEIGSGDLTVDNSLITSLKLDITDGDARLDKSDLTRIVANIESGDFDLGFRRRISLNNLDLFTGVGEITLDDETVGGDYTSEERPTQAKYEITLGTGDITLKSNVTGETAE